MKHNLVNFTRGSQLLGHFGFMFAAGLKGPLLVTVLVILGLGWWEVQSSLSEQEVYLLWMHLYASAYGFMEFDPAKLVHLKLGDGETAAFPMSVVTQYPPMRAAVAALLSMTAGQASTVGRPQGYLDSVKAPLTAPPGSKFQYGPTPMQIFGEIMRRKLVSKGEDSDPRRYIERRILAPLGVTVGDWRNGPDGAPLMPQGLVLAASEWAKIGEFVRAGGKLEGKALVDEGAFVEMFKGSKANPAYGLTWWLPRSTSATDLATRSTDITAHAGELPADMVVAAGAGDQRLYVIPSHRLTIVRQAKLDFAAFAAGKGSEWSDRRFLSMLLNSTNK